MPEQTNSKRERILSEVLLEIRFNGAPDLSLLVGKMDSALHDRYPDFQNLNIPDFPTGIPNFDTIESTVWPRATASIAFLAMMLSVYTIAGHPAITQTVSAEFNGKENMISLLESKSVEASLTTQEFSFITAMGFEDDSVSFPEMFI